MVKHYLRNLDDMNMELTVIIYIIQNGMNIKHYLSLTEQCCYLVNTLQQI